MLFQQSENGGNVNEGEKRGRELIISGGDPPEVFYLQEEAFNEMTFFIPPPVTTPRDTGIAFGRDSTIGILELNIVRKFIASIGFVGKNHAVCDLHMRQDLDRHRGIIDVSRGQLKVKRISQSVNDCMNFCYLTASTRADELIDIAVYSSFFESALCWWTFTLVESRDRFSISAYSLSAEKIRENVPSSRHLQKWLYTVFHET